MTGQDDQDKGVWLPMSPAQVQYVVQQTLTSKRPGSNLLGLLLALGGSGELLSLHDLVQDERYNDRRLSQATIVSLLLLTAFASGEPRKITAVAKEIGLPEPTAVRYAKTWVAIGVLEQDHKSRRYRLAIRWADGPMPRHKRSTSPIRDCRDSGPTHPER